MSNVTNAILTWSVMENGDDGKGTPVDTFINPKLEELYNQRFADIDEAPDAWYGGSKWMEANIAMAAFNYVSTEQILEIVRQAPWKEPQYVRLMTCEQEESAFSIYALKPEWLEERY